MLARERHGVPDVRHAGAACDQRRPAIDHGVPHRAGLVVAVVVRQEQASAQRRSQRVDGARCDGDGLAGQCDGVEAVHGAFLVTKVRGHSVEARAERSIRSLAYPQAAALSFSVALCACSVSSVSENSVASIGDVATAAVRARPLSDTENTAGTESHRVT